MKLFLCTVSMIVVVTVNCHGPTPDKPPDPKPPQPEHQPQATNSRLKPGYLNATTLVTNGTADNVVHGAEMYSRDSRSGCYDRNQFCLYWSNEGECDKSPGWMLNTCPKSCGQCGNLRADHRCGNRFLAHNGEPAQCNPEAANYCCSSEGFCGGSDGHCKCSGCVDYRGSGCYDRNQFCLYWSNEGECDKSPGWMLNTCPKSCGQCDTSCQCGVINTSRIVGGTEVNPKRKYPWQIGLVIPGNYIQCGGSIINDRWILTAAHCITDKNIIKYDKSSKLKVIVGEHNQFQTKEQDPKKKEYSIKTYIKHEDYDYETVRYDFALLELTEAIPFNNKIRPVCLPKDDSKTYVGQTGTVTGWGRTSTSGEWSHFLREVQVPILANDNCGNYIPTPEAMKLCAGGEGGKDSCHADSGGPLHVVENNKYVQVGIVSYNALQSGCASTRYPGVYARVSKVIPWITTTTASGKKCD